MNRCAVVDLSVRRAMDRVGMAEAGAGSGLDKLQNTIEPDLFCFFITGGLDITALHQRPAHVKSKERVHAL